MDEGWYTGVGSTATRVFRVESARRLAPGTPLAVRAAFLAIMLTLIAVSLVIIVPAVIFGAIVFFVSLGVMSVTRLFRSGVASITEPKQRENVRVRLPGESSEVS